MAKCSGQTPQNEPTQKCTCTDLHEVKHHGARRRFQHAHSSCKSHTKWSDTIERQRDVMEGRMGDSAGIPRSFTLSTAWVGIPGKETSLTSCPLILESTSPACSPVHTLWFCGPTGHTDRSKEWGKVQKREYHVFERSEG